MVAEDAVDLTSCAGTDPRKVCCKLLQFHTNHRPAYFGSWRKKSNTISPRAPFRKDIVSVSFFLRRTNDNTIVNRLLLVADTASRKFSLLTFFLLP